MKFERRAGKAWERQDEGREDRQARTLMKMKESAYK